MTRSEDEHGVVLHEEEVVVVEKRVAPKERVHLDKGDGHRGAGGVQQVREEHIEAEGRR